MERLASYGVLITWRSLVHDSEEAAAQGADDHANPAVNSMDDVGRAAEGGSKYQIILLDQMAKHCQVNIRIRLV